MNVCYLQTASQWLVSIRTAGKKRGEFTEQYAAVAQSGRRGCRRECTAETRGLHQSKEKKVK